MFIMHIIAILLINFKLAGICQISGPIRARLHETNSLCHPHWIYPGKIAGNPVGDTGTIPYRLCNLFPGAPGNRWTGVSDGYRMWFLNLWAMGWSRDM